jgi:hypothetical protein
MSMNYMLTLGNVYLQSFFNCDGDDYKERLEKYQTGIKRLEGFIIQ